VEAIWRSPTGAPIYIKYSHYGSWLIHVENFDELPLDAVTGVRFEFDVTYGANPSWPEDMFFPDNLPGRQDAPCVQRTWLA
jgi:hypothetical protein